MDGGLGVDDVPAHEHGHRHQQPHAPAHRQLRAEDIAERREANVHAREKQHQADICIEDAREDPRKRQPPQVQRDDLKHEEEREDRQQRHGDLTHVFRDGVQVLPAHLDGVFQRGDDRLGRGVRLGLIDRAEQQHRRDRPDRAQRHKTEAVGLGVLVASDGRDAYSERHDERNRHRPGRHAAGVERDGEDRPVREKRAEKHERVEHDQQRPQRDAEQNTRHADHEEQTHADGHREHEGGFVDGGDVRREYLQIRFGDGDGRAEDKAQREDEPQAARLRHLRANEVADAAHGHVRPEGEQSHSDDQQQ